MPNAANNEIFLLSLSYRDFLDESYASLFDTITRSSQIKRAKSSAGAIRYLEANKSTGEDNQ
jgi:hypothetical protein